MRSDLMRPCWELTEAEYVGQRIAASEVSRAEFLAHYPLTVLADEYASLMRQTPRDHPIDLDIFDALPVATQNELVKFNYTLRDRLIAREADRHRAVYAPIDAALANIRPRIAALKAKCKANKGNLNKADSATLARLESAEHELVRPFVTLAERLTVAKRYSNN
jgi:ribosome-associated translation inhibitor RaiA